MSNDLHNRSKIYHKFYNVSNFIDLDPNLVRFVFGDNCHRQGQGGQAIVRYCPVAIGIATKRTPGHNDQDYFNDDSLSDWSVIESDILKVEKLMLDNPNLIVYFPVSGIGSGLSEMPIRCPNLFKQMNELIHQKFGVNYAHRDTE